MCFLRYNIYLAEIPASTLSQYGSLFGAGLHPSIDLTGDDLLAGSALHGKHVAFLSIIHEIN
jgi:hypothetical protein